ncbi:MAG TPA: hypothetical protein VGK94_11755 [Candidatus Polarisedimenticolia bacterium]
MKQFLKLALMAAAILGAGSIAATVRTWPRWIPHLTAQICVERPENNGVLNIRYAQVVIRGGPTLTLAGGEAACAWVEGGGVYYVWVQSRDPYDPTDTGPTAWRSTDLKLEVKQNSRVDLLVCGVGVRGAYTNWSVQFDEQMCK